MVRSFGVSDAGTVRRSNEDSFLADDELSLFVVADGMGGHAAGEVASKLAVESIENFVRRSQDCGDFSWPCGIDPTLTFAGNRVRTAIYLANRRVFRVAEAHDDYTGMGTTVVCGLISGRQLAIGHVGDSRLYLFSRGVLSVQTQDDTWAATVLAGPDSDPNAVNTHPLRHVLTNVLGARDQTDIHVSERDLAHGDLLLLCTDGIHNVLDTASLEALVASSADLQQVSQSIVNTALQRGSRDNVTALLVQYQDEGAGHA
jgi:PPM family protein phosphatase